MLSCEDILHKEKLSVLLHAKYNFLCQSELAGKIKNVNDSKNIRDIGNKLYCSRPHDKFIHEEICSCYSQSIALAPNNSEELAMGYGNRSALFFHVKKYKESIIDIDRAVSISSHNLYKVKLLCRKAECLKMLNESTKLVCEEALQMVEHFEASEKAVYSKKLSELLVHKKKSIKRSMELCENDSYIHDLLNFERSNEIPSASKSVALNYDKKWGRHIIATEDIKPGEIICAQECFMTTFNQKINYLICSYCKTISFNSVPCEHCVHSLYCSEACRSEAWNKYHQYECIIFEHNSIINYSILYMNFVLSAIYEAGSIEQMKEYILEIENTKDPRIKGFSNTKFFTEQKQNLYTLKKISLEDVDYKIKYLLIADICNYIYILAKFTNFFGQKMDVVEQELFLNEDMLFVAALILRTYLICSFNYQTFLPKVGKLKLNATVTSDIYSELFSSMINHSCLGNVIFIRTDDGKNIVFASQPIKKGTQLFKSHKINFLIPKKKRQESFKIHRITCECIACLEDWSPIVPSIESFFAFTHSLDYSFIHEHRILMNQIRLKQGLSKFTSKIFNQVCRHLSQLAEKFNVVNAEYFELLKFVIDFLDQQFHGNYFEMPAECE